MAGLIFLVLNLGASFFKSRCRLEAENAALRVASRSSRHRRANPTNQAWPASPYQPAPAITSNCGFVATLQ
jgi:hypothetical protein